ncbi:MULTISPECIES: alpha/beta hydrolase [unclassified Bradyrhizobium]|uniref:alpha/beta fold hydrolase n=1 Tax=unclassified Bradyrhizobium TaxID=2631580 RepID=UPI001FF7570D|nr:MULTISPECIES: alpha/beta hydrolase [unclassified Bradyrhizobium]MCK1537521.1 alpha/beta hydrolase [Bradyrhizobium sp. 176]MCK1554909.1 alpha/beta hydrolase [Bradyrhizobium sp. 171]
MTDSENCYIDRRDIVGGTSEATAAVQVARKAQFASVASTPARTSQASSGHQVEISFLQIDHDLTLRRMVVHAPSSRGTVLFLHGFPETLYAWKDISIALADEYEVHAFDWPGYGLSSRPSAERFSYAPREYARVLDEYISTAGIEKSMLTIYATDIGALPALLLALDNPEIARRLIVGDFAPFDRPAHMYDSLQKLKAGPAMDQVRAFMNKNREEILQNTFTRGLPEEARYRISQEFSDDAAKGWSQGEITTVDAFAHYYSHFTRDQDYLESHLAKLNTPVKVLWGEKDLYISKQSGVEFADRVHAELTVLPGIGHYPHLQDPQRTVAEVRASFGSRATPVVSQPGRTSADVQ